MSGKGRDPKYFVFYDPDLKQLGYAADPSVNIVPSVDYASTLFYDSTKLPISNVKMVVLNGLYQIINLSSDVGSLLRNYVVVVNGTIQYVNDVRHSHDVEIEDTTSYVTYNTTYTEVARIDYGSVLTVKEMYTKMGLWASSGVTAYAKIQYSSDGTTWYDLTPELSTTSTSEQIFSFRRYSLSFRYLRIILYTTSAGYGVYVRWRKIIIIK